MSHIVSIKTKFTDAAALAAACGRLGLPQPVSGTAQLFTTQATGLIVSLPDWIYPVVVDTASPPGRSESGRGRFQVDVVAVVSSRRNEVRHWELEPHPWERSWCGRFRRVSGC